MPDYNLNPTPLEVLSPRSANIPSKPRTVMKKPKQDVKPKAEEKPTNPDRIDDKWRPPSTVSEPCQSPEIYHTGKKLGKGGFAVCFEGKTERKGEVFALKVVKAQVQQKKMMEKFRTEMQIHAKMSHPNIVEFYRAFSLEGYTYVVLEMCENGSLTDMVKARTCLSLPEVRRFMIQICGGVKYLHRRSVIHRDLKMGNIFIDAQLNLKIGDFGLAAVMADDQDRRTTLCGTPNYIAPEILSKSGTRGHDYKVDTWAVGVICYAMLMGTPPFQSKTQQEIYTKLKTLEYEWRADSMNYITQEAKDFVASCLNLVAAERPDMDELVEHEFFKSGAIADVLDKNCLQTKPDWLQNADPRGDKVAPGYGIDHGRICADCGVGTLLDGRPRPSVGAKAKISALVEIEVENRQGTAPVTPLPEGVLYKQFIQPQTEAQSRPFTTAQPRSRKPTEDLARPSEQTATIRSQIAPQISTMLPQRSIPSAKQTQSFAAQQRQQALPKNAMPRTTTLTQELLDQVPSVVEDKPFESQGLLKARPVRAASTRSTRSTQNREVNGLRPTKNSENLSEPSRQQNHKQEQLQASSRDQGAIRIRPRSLRSQAPTRPLSITALPSSDGSEEAVTAKSQPPRGICPEQKSVTVLSSQPTDRLETRNSKRTTGTFKPRLIGNSDSYSQLPSMAHAKLQKSMRNLYVSLGLQCNTLARPSRKRRLDHSAEYPRVDKWVDYATKHGIAYILTDGSLGMILKSRAADGIASSSVVVRNARRHTVLRARGVEHQFVPQGNNVPDVEFYEQVDMEAEMKRLDVPSKEFELDLHSHSSQSGAATALLNTLSGSAAQRMKEVGLLDKFGKYMNKQMGAADFSDDDSTEAVQKGHFIHFYQRMGNVGIWRFADGGLQFNFPDHTKLVIHQTDSMALDDDALVDILYLEPADAKELKTNGILTNEVLERRGQRTVRLSEIRDGTLDRMEVDLVQSNEIREKLSWIRGVIGCWLKEGGLGWTGEEKLGWSGIQERRDDKRIKLQWVTVGRPGGDD